MIDRESLDESISHIVDPYGEDSLSQEETQEIGYLIYKQNEIVCTIGTEECKFNIDLFLEEILDNNDFYDSIKFLKRCFNKLNEEYHLGCLEDTISKLFAFQDFRKSIVPLLIFFEKEKGAEIFSECFPYVDINTLREIDSFKKFIELNYENFLKVLNARQDLEMIIKSIFNFASLDDAIFILWQIVSKDVTGINSSQILKGE